MTFNTAKFMRALFLTLLVGLLAWGAADRFLGWGQSGGENDPAVLAQQARDALEAVKRRTPGDRRPASYDAVLAPLDRLLILARDMLQSIDYDPVNDYPKLSAIAEPVVAIATDANAQARTETGPLAKEFRFNSQKAEACQYLASGMWSRLEARQASSGRGFDNQPSYPEGEVHAVMTLIGDGLDADPLNKQLWYMRGVVNRANGLFAAAARDLERSVEIDPNNGAAWNVLGLVNISLRQFDKAEESLERGKNVLLDQAKADNVKPGAEYTTALFNLARFHEGLAAFYARENRIDPSPENQRMAARHGTEARKYFQEFLDREPQDSQDAALARRLIDSLP